MRDAGGLEFAVADPRLELLRDRNLDRVVLVEGVGCRVMVQGLGRDLDRVIRVWGQGSGLRVQVSRVRCREQGVRPDRSWQGGQCLGFRV